MSLGSSPPRGGAGSVDNDQGEPYDGDPRIAPGLPRPVGWLVRKPDGTAAYYKFGVADISWTALPGPASSWPGFGASVPPNVTIASALGVSGVAAQSDHTHGGQGNLVNTDSINTGGTKLSALDVSTLQRGALAFVVSVGAVFRLTQSALTVDHVTVETAFNKAGYQWIRIDLQSRYWASKTAFFVDGSNSSGVASDENDGLTSATPVLTRSEIARRLFQARMTVAFTVTILSDCLTTDTPVWTYLQSGAGFLTETGVPTVLRTGTITTFTATAAPPSADDVEMSDTSIPVSFTASGLMATNLLYKRTNGTVVYWFAAADLGGKTIRISQPIDVANTTTLIALAPGDTYQVLQLPKIYTTRYPAGYSNPARVELCDDRSASTSFIPHDSVAHRNCTETNAYQRVASYTNCAFNSAKILWNGPLGNSIAGGILRGTGASQYTIQGGGSFSINARVTLQGCGLLLSGSTFLLFQGTASGSLYQYDSSAIGLWAAYWSTALFFSGTLSGKNNTGKLLSASRWSQIAYLATLPSPPFNALSTSDPSPITVGNVDHPIADLPVYTVATNGCAIYATY